MNEEQKYKYFLAALRDYLDEGGRGEKASLAEDIEVSASLISQVTKHPPKKNLGMKNQITIANKIEGSYEKFIERGMRVLSEAKDGVVIFQSEEEKTAFDLIRNGFQDKKTIYQFVEYLEKLEKLDIARYEGMLSKIKIYVKKKESKDTPTPIKRKA